MRWPWQDRALTREKKARADEQAVAAEADYDKTLASNARVTGVLAMFFYHAEKNQVIENLHRLARGH